MIELKEAIEIFEKNGIKTQLDNNNMIIISAYNQPKGTTFKEQGINEDELISHVVACDGKFETRKSALTTFPLVACRELRMDEATEITEMPNLKYVGVFVVNKKLKKLPKLKIAGSVSMEESIIKSLPKLREIEVLIAQNSKLEELPSLERANKLCIVDTPIKDLKELESAGDIFICSSDVSNKNELSALPALEDVDKLFIANSDLKALPKLKKAKKVALYNCEIKSFKGDKDCEVEIKTEISDEELSEKFDNFTEWYNSDILNKSMNLLGEMVTLIQS